LENAQLPVGTTTIVWTIIDEVGNENTCSFDVTVNDFVGLNDLSDAGISIYPNPTDGVVNIDFSEIIDMWKVTITDISGKQMLEITELFKQNRIDLTQYSKGVYFIKIKTNHKVYVEKIVLQF